MSDISDIHDALHAVPGLSENARDGVGENIRAHVPDVRAGIYRRTARIHSNESPLEWREEFSFAGECIREKYGRLLCASLGRCRAFPKWPHNYLAYRY